MGGFPVYSLHPVHVWHGGCCQIGHTNSGYENYQYLSVIAFK